jgi:serine/threonine protein kinase
MEYVGDSLGNALFRFKGTHALVILSQLIEVVEFMHSKNYAQRDTKPENILIHWRKGQPVLEMADVGSMKGTDEDFKSFAGTPLYIAPECWSTTRQYNKEVDMWTVGLVLLQLFAEWDLRADKAWVSGPCWSRNALGFSVWISTVLMSFVVEADPHFVQELLSGLLRESPKERWTAAMCQA